MKVFAGGPQYVADAKAVIGAGRTGLDTALPRRLAKQFGRDAAELLEELIAS